MYALVSPKKMQLPAGAVVRLPATWSDYQALLSQRGDGSVPRIKYCNGEVLLMAPLPVHGRDASSIADIVKALLDHQGQEYDAFTPITMELPDRSGIEPDYCFYIDHWQAISGKQRIDWQTDPPPDLVIEIDVTSYTNIEDYLPYQVPEVWLYRKQQLLVYCLQGKQYIQQFKSQYCPSLQLQEAVSRCLQLAYDRNTSAAIRDLKQQLR
ncbi:MAG: Uma2 family endonuclease [Cyanobacteria bacterium J06597_16]